MDYGYLRRAQHDCEIPGLATASWRGLQATVMRASSRIGRSSSDSASIMMPHRDAARPPPSGASPQRGPRHRGQLTEVSLSTATDESPKGLQGDGRHSAQSDQTQQHTQTTRQHTHTYTHTKPARECKKNAYTVHLDHGAYTVHLDHGAAHGLVERVHYLRATVSASDSLAS